MVGVRLWGFGLRCLWAEVLSRRCRAPREMWRSRRRLIEASSYVHVLPCTYGSSAVPRPSPAPWAGGPGGMCGAAGFGVWVKVRRNVRGGRAEGRGGRAEMGAKVWAGGVTRRCAGVGSSWCGQWVVWSV